jgi:hypothetical protein
MATSSSASSFG